MQIPVLISDPIEANQRQFYLLVPRDLVQLVRAESLVDVVGQVTGDLQKLFIVERAIMRDGGFD
ncbi:hypothetical protein Harman_41060 [Haloarcula mannanilytica]|uniref:Uncharacterized protein n=1 Tax=Haloarcula mannanilytica TaxID=2509225 RepID=A0A4C2ENR7_9EURY|nr:hypothetical protein Harman_41060 [Haloarcula mannanilytica]